MEWTIQKNDDFEIGFPISKSDCPFKNRFVHFSGLSIPFEIHLFSISQDFRIFPFKGVREHPKACVGMFSAGCSDDIVKCLVGESQSEVRTEFSRKPRVL